MTAERWHDQIQKLRSRHAETLDALVPESSSVALLNYPNHPNVGDSAIWLGELEYLRRRRCSIAYVSDLVSHDRTKLAAKLPLDGIILLHGGGNLGDLWTAHQLFRERVLRDHPENRVVVFPQTVNFQNDQALESAKRAFASHHHLTLVTRDLSSYAFARRAFDCQVELAPDSAFWLSAGDLAQIDAQRDLVWLARTDHESAGPHGLKPYERTLAVDWLSPEGEPIMSAGRAHYVTLQKLTKAMAHLGPRGRRIFASAQQAQFHPAARWHVERGCRLLGAGRVVITDRLHAHILSIVLGIPQVLVDDAHLKVRHFWETWTKDLPAIVWASSDEEALTAAAALHRSDRGEAGRTERTQM